MFATVTDIKRFAVHDGDGIRTTVFLKGCPLRCVWCHNPEGLTPKKQLAYFSHKCISCGSCVNVCNAHVFENGIHSIARELCKGCGKCADVCPSEALKLYGKEMSVSEIFEIVTEDIEFYKSSGGGVTVSGGECLLYPDFCAELLRACKTAGINTTIDTCGYVSKSAFDKVIPYTDTFLYDIKAYDDDIHIKCTEVSNRIILDNLKYIDSLGCKTEIRIPYVPEYNSNQIEKISGFVQQLKNIIRVRVLPYHNYAGSKYESLGMLNILPEVRLPSADECTALEKKYF